MQATISPLQKPMFVQVAFFINTNITGIIDNCKMHNMATFGFYRSGY